MTPWLSVILPIHKGAAFLDATLTSAAAGDCSGMEFLFYDSGQDGGASHAIAMRHADRLNIIWTDTPETGPWTAKINRGVAQARGAHITMLHQDDLWLAGHHRALADTVKTMGDAALSIGPSRLIGSRGQNVGPWRMPFTPGRHKGRDLAATLIVQNTIAVPSPIFRRDTFLAVGGMDDALWYTADWDLYLKLALAGDVLVRDGATTGFRLHGQSLTMTGSRDIADFRAQNQFVLDRHLPALRPLPKGGEARAMASVAVNCALAEASRGRPGGLARAIAQVATLGPAGWRRFLRETSLYDRVAARVRLKLAGDM
ncbi:glycosyltransferase [Novosphingobium rosa]|uniref:glycosyltransferase n=1 Tax=Novosphingobium rosa TaxID=76978 RepID=UPI000835D605|nr:glycosyltransferase [Novosphingobium rosa]